MHADSDTASAIASRRVDKATGRMQAETGLELVVEL